MFLSVRFGAFAVGYPTETRARGVSGISIMLMSETAKLELDGKQFDLPVVTGSENEKGIDISKLRAATGHITLDDGYGNTGSCSSAVTFIDGEKGILRYRGIPIEELAEKASFIEAAYLLIYGHLPNRDEMGEMSELLTQNQNLHENMKHHFEGFPPNSHPMAMLSSMINASSCFYPGLMNILQHTGRHDAGLMTKSCDQPFAHIHRAGVHPIAVRAPPADVRRVQQPLPHRLHQPGHVGLA